MQRTTNMTDPIADMLSRIRNATAVRRKRVDVPASRLKTEIARILQSEGYIDSFKMVEVVVERGQMARPMIRIYLKYGSQGEKVISGIERVSRPGRRVYFGRDAVPPVLAGLGTSILTTSRGIMTGRDAVKEGVGGEVLCNVW
jgi:small subunit ribosomal protein S8|tara:strand:+ start:1542 stop:1970 length:429 start_codon:yes stop_codon:yes gene_type:complete